MSNFTCIVTCNFSLQISRAELHVTFRAKFCARVEAVSSHAAHVAMNAFIQGEQQTLVVVPGTQSAQRIQTQPDLRVVILACMVHCAPSRAPRELIMLFCCCAPLRIGRGLVHLLLESLLFASVFQWHIYPLFCVTAWVAA